MKILEFIFQSFPHFLGSCILLALTFDGIVNIIRSLKLKKK